MGHARKKRSKVLLGFFLKPIKTLNALQTASASFNNLVGWLETRPDYEDLINIALKARTKVRTGYTETIDKELRGYIIFKLFEKISNQNNKLFNF